MNQIQAVPRQDLATILQAPSTLLELAKALPEHLNVKRFARIALTEVRKNPELAKCSAASFMGALVQAAQLGLEPGSGLGHAYLIPYRNNKTNEVDCTFIPGYKGLLELARRSGAVKRMSAACVYQGDSFDYELGSSEFIKHKPCGETRAVAVTHAYAICEFKDGGIQMEVMTRNQIDAIKTRGRQNKVWDSDFPEMAKKTALRRLCKYLPLSPELSDAIRIDSESDEILSLPDRPNPMKHAQLIAEDSEAQADARHDLEYHEACNHLSGRWTEVELAGGSPEEIIGVSLKKALTENVNFIDAASGRLEEFLKGKK